MKNNMELIISVGRSRKETDWKQQRIMWADFISKLSVPVESTETQEEYFALTKSKQDNLKDVGGFIGGALKGGRRKSGIANRCLVTLDMDNIPAGQTDGILKRVASLGCAYVVYSTRKHTGYAPRLRVIIPTDRTVEADEYEPIARKIAEMVGIKFCDPTTFQTGRFMYWPSTSRGAEYIFDYGDMPFLSADGILGMYEDWHDIKTWPIVYGEQKSINGKVKRLGNPADKDNIIGSFCRVYDIPSAIEHFIPDIYEPCEGDRYTYKAGSTTGGAVLYDGGSYLYSNHATDPAEGKCCNAFDLVRIHKFGFMDENSPEGTPVNRLPSYGAMRDFAMQDEAVKKERIGTAFGVKEEGREPYPDIKIIGDKVVILPTADNLRTLLTNEGIRVSYSIIRRKVVVKCDNTEKEEKFNNGPNSYGNLLTYCADQFVREGLKTSTAKVHEWVTQIADDNRVNEAREYLELNHMVYRGAKGFKELFDCLRVSGDAQLSRVLLEKWLCQCVAMAHNEKGEFGADGVLVLKGPHGIGKTSFFRKCCSVGLDYFIEGAFMDGSKDKLMENTSAWIGELGELPRSMKDLESMKAFITSAKDKFRTPYSKKAEIYPRLTSFGATTNSDAFLKEDRERRFWVIDVEDIDINALNEVSFEAVWEEAYARFKILGAMSFRLTFAEREKLREENKDYRIMSEEEILLQEKLDWTQPREEWKEFTATAICERIAPVRNLSPQKVGMALKSIGYSKGSEEYPKRIKDGYSVYKIPTRNNSLFG